MSVFKQVRRRRTQPAVTIASAAPNPVEREVDEEATTSDDADMTAEEQLEINAVLTSLGSSPLALHAIPISMVPADAIPSNEVPRETIITLSDEEDGGKNPSKEISAEDQIDSNAANPEEPTDVISQEGLCLGTPSIASAVDTQPKEVTFINHHLVNF